MPPTKFELTIPAGQANRVVRALCAAAGTEATPENARQALITHIERTVANVERQPPDEPPEPDVTGIVS